MATMSAPQLELSSTLPRGPFHVPPGDWARPGLVDAPFVARSIAAMRQSPDAGERLRAGMEECLESIRAIDRVYGDELNEWAGTTRERLWLEYFTAQTIRRGLVRAK